MSIHSKGVKIWICNVTPIDSHVDRFFESFWIWVFLRFGWKAVCFCEMCIVCEKRPVFACPESNHERDRFCSYLIHRWVIARWLLTCNVMKDFPRPPSTLSWPARQIYDTPAFDCIAVLDSEHNRYNLKHSSRVWTGSRHFVKIVFRQKNSAKFDELLFWRNGYLSVGTYIFTSWWSTVRSSPLLGPGAVPAAIGADFAGEGAVLNPPGSLKVAILVLAALWHLQSNSFAIQPFII